MSKTIVYTYICCNGGCRYIEKKTIKYTYKCPQCGKAQMRIMKEEKE